MASVPKDISIQDLFLDFSPKMAQTILAESGNQAALEGTEFSLVIDISGTTYAYIVKDGKDFDVKEGDLDNPLVRIAVSKEDLEYMISTGNLDMLLGIQNDLSKAKYDALQRIKGTMTAELNDGDKTFSIVAELNGAKAPTATFKLSAADSSALVKKEANPVNLFMSGAMKIEGDMAFAMSTQPLFT